MKDRLLDSETWLQVVLEEDPWKRSRAVAAALEGMTADDAEDLVAVCKDGSVEERSSALLLLLQVARKNTDRFKVETKRRWLISASQLAREMYPHSPLGSLAFQCLLEHWREEAEEVVCAERVVEELTEEEQRRWVRDLRSLGSGRCLARLVGLEEEGGAAGIVAGEALEVEGIATREKLDAAAEGWRMHRDASSLNRLFHMYVSGLAPGTPMIDVLERLGEPTRRYGTSTVYETDGAILVIEEDDAGRFAGGWLK